MIRLDAEPSSHALHIMCSLRLHLQQPLNHHRHMPCGVGVLGGGVEEERRRKAAGGVEEERRRRAAVAVGGEPL